MSFAAVCCSMNNTYFQLIAPMQNNSIGYNVCVCVMSVPLQFFTEMSPRPIQSSSRNLSLCVCVYVTPKK